LGSAGHQKNPPKKIGERGLNVIENKQRENIGFPAFQDVVEKQ
jgi:hypothetical protein